MSILKEEFNVAKMDFVTAGEASAQIKRILKKLGVDAGVVRRLSIACYEADLPLTVDNVRKMPKQHDRCGTTFMFIVMIFSMLFFTVVPVSMINVGNGVLTFLVQLVIRIRVWHPHWVWG